MKPSKILGKNRCFRADRLAHRSHLQSDGLWLSAPPVQRLAEGAKAGEMGKSGEAVEAPQMSKNMRNGHIAKIC